MEEKNYILNFWDHGIGNEVLAHSCVDVIDEVYGELGEQVKLKHHEEINYIQDLEWVPNSEDFRGIFKRFGSVVTKDSIIYKRVIYPIPQTLEEANQTIREVRLLAYNSGVELFSGYFKTRSPEVSVSNPIHF